MKKILAMLGLVAALGLPALAFAADFTGPIVPQDFVTRGTTLQACDLVTLADNIVKFAIFAGTLVATLMFLYAGFLYVTASADSGNIDKAKKIFTDALIGFVFILGAWLIIDTLLHVFVGAKLGPWNKIECVNLSSDYSPSTNGGVTSGSPQTTGSETDNRLALAGCGVSVNKSACAAGVTYQSTSGGCTSVGGLQSQTIGEACSVAQSCAGCKVEITGGSEAGHSPTGAHPDGTAIDVSQENTALNNKVTSWQQTSPGHYKDPNSCAVWYDEPAGATANTTAHHWHVTVPPSC